ncbi:MAG: sugar O-acetyltransferase, partial [Eubacterium sp.]|nr:sugar O-acetyltransferase [Eubacterium sp.]
MTELEKLDAGLEYDFWDEEVNGRKLRAVEICGKLNQIPQTDEAVRTAVIKELFASVGENPTLLPGFNCDYGLHIYAGKNFLCNYNVTILDIAPVTIGDYVMIGHNTLITTVNHPLNLYGRRKHLAIAKPVT